MMFSYGQIYIDSITYHAVNEQVCVCNVTPKQRMGTTLTIETCLQIYNHRLWLLFFIHSFISFALYNPTPLFHHIGNSQVKAARLKTS